MAKQATLGSGCGSFEPVGTRRDLLRMSACGFGWLALSHLMAEQSRAAPIDLRDPLAPRPAHFPARAQRVIFLFMHGGPSQVDTFDYKPLLVRDHGRPLPFNKPRVFSSKTGNLLKSPWQFRQYARHVDDLCFIKSMWGSNSRHGGALLELHTGSDTFVRPSLGSWIVYGLGTENRDLPGFITICPTLTHGGVNAYGSAFLPAVYHGAPMGNASTPAEQAKFPFIENADKLPRAWQARELELIRHWNQQHLQAAGPDAALEGRINSFELAFRMQTTAPQLQEIDDETPATHRMYGLDDPATRNFGRQCLMARRFVERGVRFVQCTHSYKWDQHDNLTRDHAKNAMEVDQPIAALLSDLKQRGLLQDTLVLWGGEFGRTPVVQGGGDGRDHNPQGYTMWLAGGGVKPGHQYGATDDYGYYAVQDKVHLHDLHATMLHLLGLDHLQLTYRYAGRDFRLTDVHGEIVRGILA
jgi:hypothetical protein